MMEEGKRPLLFHKWITLLGGTIIVRISEEIIPEGKSKGALHILHEGIFWHCVPEPVCYPFFSCSHKTG